MGKVAGRNVIPIEKEKYIKKLKLANRIYAILLIIYMMATLVQFGLLYRISEKTNYPTISIYKKELEINLKEKNAAGGRYIPFENHIYISSNRINSEYLLETIYHEYGHYLYNKVFTKEEILLWSFTCKKNHHFLELYDEKDRCEEEFAFAFAGYIMNKTTDNYFISTYENVNGIKFVGEKYEKYIKERPSKIFG